jgi:hypothetical protein
MIDADVMQDRIRDANPIPTLDALDADELAYFLATTRTRRPAAMQAPTQHPTPTTPRTPPPRPRLRRAWAFAAGFVVILLVVGAAALFLRGGDTPVGDEPAPEPTVTTPEVATTATAETPTDPIRVESLTWSRVPHDEAVFGLDGPSGLMSIEGSLDLRGAVAVIEGGPGLVAVGGSGDDAAIWTSTDGISWSRVPHDEAVFGGEGHSAAVSVTNGGPGLVAVGFTGFGDNWSGAAWTSPDGLTWSRMSFEEDEGLVMFTTVTAGGPGLVAIVHGGSDWPAFISPDGITWTAAADLPGADYVSEVAVGGPGLVAVGVAGGESDSEDRFVQDAAVWTSQDGLTWSRIPHDEAMSGVALCETASILNVEHPEWSTTAMTGITAGGPGFVAVGNVDCGDQRADPQTGRGAVVWTSQDGITWSRVPYDAAIFGAASMTDVIAVGDGLVAVGVNHSELSDGAVVWTSGDGITWDRIPYEADVFGGLAGMSSVTEGGPGLVAVGADEEGTVVWTATTAD